MANTLYDIARKKFLAGQLSWFDTNAESVPTDKNFKAMLIDTTGNTDAALPSKTSATLIAGAGTLASIGSGTYAIKGPITMLTHVSAVGAADADDITFSAVALSANAAEGILIYYDDGANGIPIVWIDNASGLPITPNGGDIIITWDNGTNKIFRL